MPPRLLVIALVPPADFSRFLRGLRAQYPDAEVVALVGSSELRLADGPDRPDECLSWGSYGARALVSEIRRRRFDLLVMPYNPDYCHRVTYWKALALAIASGARGMLFCERARLPGGPAPLSSLARPLARAGALLSAIAVRGIPRVAAFLLAELLIALLGSMMVIVLAGIAAADLGEAIAAGGARRTRNRAGSR